MAARRLRAAVVGAGRLGTLHARKYAAMPEVELRAIVDVDLARAEELARELHAAALRDYRDLGDTVDLVSIAVPGVAHHTVARDLLLSGIDVLLEKPMAATLTEARDLSAIAAASGHLLQIGHLERFNPAIVHLRSILDEPRFIECHRLALFTERGLDVDVVLDLMVHDLDVVLSTAAAAPTSLEAVGVAVLTDQVDVANARIRFADGMIANLNASRVAPRRERKIRFFQHDAYISVDYEARRLQLYRRTPPAPGSAYPTIAADQIDLEEGDPLADEIRAFVACVQSRTAPPVGPADGLRVMELCELIRRSIREQGRVVAYR
ncbi:MAG TPA: Gfo/Idh/MocA family oxidoreductase [Candidatus Binataceae bacterium]|jgi:predicted dehydrogenase|nr:Gfo/Idh/MocA family oxidoreductase [Candidatus Binataceae bacterium]